MNTSVTFTASLTGATLSPVVPNGTMAFTLNGTAIAGCSAKTVSASGVSSCTTATLPVGTNTVTATYWGDANFVASFPGSSSYTITAALNITSASSTTFTVGAARTFTVTATGSPTPTFSQTGALPGRVTLSADGVLSGTPASGTGGTYPITITASNGVSPNATPAFTLTVNQAPAITSVNNATFTVGAAGTFTVTATGVPAPTFSTTGLPSGVTLSAGGVLSGTPASGTGGTYPIAVTASNGVSPNATQGFMLTVNPMPLTITADNKTKVYGAPLPSFTVSYSGFVNGDTPGVLNGTLLCTTGANSNSTVGTYPITCSGQTSINYAISYAPGQLSITQDPTSTTITSSATPTPLGQSVTFTAAVAAAPPGSGAPTGTVTFKDGTTTLGTGSLTSGQATFTTSTLAAGSHSITAQYGGDTNFIASSSGSVTEQVQYGLCALYDQTKAVQSGANVPIKLYLCDVNGNDLSSPSTVLHATQVVAVTGYSGAPESPGNSNPDNDFVFDSTLGTTGGYHFNLKTTGLASGTYILQFVVTNDPVMHSVNFGVH